MPLSSQLCTVVFICAVSFESNKSDVDVVVTAADSQNVPLFDPLQELTTLQVG